MSWRSHRIAIPRCLSMMMHNRTLARASNKVGGMLNATTPNEEEKTTKASSNCGHCGAAVPRSDNNEHLKDQRLTLDRASQSQVERAVVDVSSSMCSLPNASFSMHQHQIPPPRQASLSLEDAPASLQDTYRNCMLLDDNKEMDHIPPSSSIQGQPSHPPTTPGPPDSTTTTQRILMDLYEEMYCKRGQNAFNQSKMHECKEDFAIWLKEMKGASIREGLAMNAKIREQWLKDSLKTHMTKPDYGGELLDEAIGDIQFDGMQREWSEQELNVIATANKTFQEAADLPFKSPH
ncbi:hypothetical protein BDP27DRAFT_1310760 [Rhodocollybia butyracea]|uniref:Uncharacterized protein n=1 Tax=Rhodocollybia butyracea TaxID=206335 RepID=A0A9P5UG86_9AGAR|nr:hypothetical protein BDP27DRAFT_1310760 [Rhodocollybia butyracea]